MNRCPASSSLTELLDVIIDLSASLDFEFDSSSLNLRISTKRSFARSS